MRVLLDVNALVALFDADHVFHARVRAWWAANQSAGWATCPLTQNGFIRIMSQPGYPGRRPIVENVKALREGVMQASHEFWPDDISISDPQIFDHGRILGPSQITDVYLLALAVEHGGRLATFDRGIPLAAVRRAEPRYLAIV